VYADMINNASFGGDGENALLLASYDREGHPAGLHHVSAWEDAFMDQLVDAWVTFDGCGAPRVGSFFDGQMDFGQGTLVAPLSYCVGAGEELPGLASVVARVAP
jgi:hypothetical protein